MSQFHGFRKGLLKVQEHQRRCFQPRSRKRRNKGIRRAEPEGWCSCSPVSARPVIFGSSVIVAALFLFNSAMGHKLHLRGAEGTAIGDDRGTERASRLLSVPPDPPDPLPLKKVAAARNPADPPARTPQPTAVPSAVPSAPPSARATPPLTAKVAEVKELDSPASWCKQMLAKHSVQPGVSWGTLPARERQLWSQKKCDDLTFSDEAAADEPVENLMPIAKACKLDNSQRPKDARDPRRANRVLHLCQSCGSYLQPAQFYVCCLHDSLRCCRECMLVSPRHLHAQTAPLLIPPPHLPRAIIPRLVLLCVCFVSMSKPMPMPMSREPC